MPARRAVTGLVTLLLAALAFTFPLVACSSDDDDDGGTDFGDSDVVVTGDIESSWDGGAVWDEAIEVEGLTGFVIVLYNGTSTGASDELVAFFRQDGGKPGNGSYTLGDGLDPTSFVGAYIEGDATSPLICISDSGAGGTLNITGSGGNVTGNFDFDASCFSTGEISPAINVDGSFDAEEVDDLDVPI